MEVIIIRHGTTEMNETGLGYDNFNKDEIYHLSDKGKIDAEKTGQYLATFGNFDQVFCSPRHRCIETFDIIKRYINYKKLSFSSLLLESPQGILNGLDKSAREIIIAKNKKLDTLKIKYKQETNLFKKAKAHKAYIDERNRYLKRTPDNTIRKNYIKFLKQLSKLRTKRILVVAHSGTVVDIAQIVLNISYYDDILLAFNDKQQLLFNHGGCMLIGLLYDKKFQLVIPPNNRHIL